MPTDSSLGLRVTRSITLRRERRLPVAGEILVQAGDSVLMDSVVARALLPGRLHPVNASARLALPPSELRPALLVKEGEPVTRGQRLAESRALFGLLRSQVWAPVDGILDGVSPMTGQLTLREHPTPLELSAYLPGTVRSVEPGAAVEIEARVCQVQGIFGLGGEVQGILELLGDDPLALPGPEAITAAHKGKILVIGGRLTLNLLEALIEKGVRGVVAPSSSGRDLMTVAGGAVNPASTGNESLGLTLMLTEGFGDIAMSTRTLRILESLAGQPVSMSGRTQIRAGVIRPEIIAAPLDEVDAPAKAGGSVRTGDTVRVIRGPRFGRLATVKEIPPALHPIEIGSKALVFIVMLEGGEEIAVPRPNVEPVSSG